MPHTTCPLCNGASMLFYTDQKKTYYQCTRCYGIFLDTQQRLTAAKELQRYQEHNNDVHDTRYQDFVLPITHAIQQNFTPQHHGLDFGAGPGPVLSKVLKDAAYQIDQYDPFFHNNPALLQNTYDYIACCEVIEHFYAPYQEFILLKRLLKPHGALYCMTSIYDQTIDFKKWYYKNDMTHVFIYQKETLEWLKQNIGFSKITINKNLIIFNT